MSNEAPWAEVKKEYWWKTRISRRKRSVYGVYHQLLTKTKSRIIAGDPWNMLQLYTHRYIYTYIVIHIIIYIYIDG